MNQFTFEKWLIYADKTYNQKIYMEYDYTSCMCIYCQNFEEYKEKIFPEECYDLFDKLGIDYHKPAEIMHVIEENNQHLYGFWYHFRGTIFPYSLGQFNLSENLSIGFYEDDAQSIFPSTDSLYQVYFETRIPWIMEVLP